MEILDEVLEHFGIKGMHWGVRGSSSRTPPSLDSLTVKGHMAIVKKSGTKALSNKDLQELVTRMNLEQQFSKLTMGNSRVQKGKKAAKGVLSAANTANQVLTLVNSPAGKMATSKLKK